MLLYDTIIRLLKTSILLTGLSNGRIILMISVTSTTERLVPPVVRQGYCCIPFSSNLKILYTVMRPRLLPTNKNLSLITLILLIFSSIYLSPSNSLWFLIIGNLKRGRHVLLIRYPFGLKIASLNRKDVNTSPRRTKISH